MHFGLRKTLVIWGILSILLCGCQKQEDIKQHWVSADSRYSLSFDEDDTVVIDGKYIGDYKIYSEGKMAINVETDMFDEVLDLTMSAEYTIDNNTLTIKNLENGELFEYYTPEKAESLYKEVPPNAMKGFMYYDFLGYFDGQDFFMEGDWDLNVEAVENGCHDAGTIFAERVIPFYEKTNPEAKLCFFSESVIGVNGQVLNIMELYTDEAETIHHIDSFAIDPAGNLIYIYDMLEDVYKLWDDGVVIMGKSLLKEM